VEKGVGVVVEMEVKAIELDLGFMGASTPGVMHSTEVVEVNMDEMIGWPIGNDIKVQKNQGEGVDWEG